VQILPFRRRIEDLGFLGSRPRLESRVYGLGSRADDFRRVQLLETSSLWSRVYGLGSRADGFRRVQLLETSSLGFMESGV
jgi:hypothetical protein